MTLLQIDDLAVSYATRGGDVPAVLDVSLAIARGESLGLVGESGCGKTTVAMAIMQHFGRSGRIAHGRILFDGEDMAARSASATHGRRGGIAMVYQDPMSTLNPGLTIGEQLAEVPVYLAGLSWDAARTRAAGMLRDVRLPDVARVMAAYPHQLSGGQQQRVVIAMALLAEPALLLLDEPTTSLDVTIEAGVIDLIADLRRRFGTTLLYISHNLGLIAHVCDRVAVMYAGEIVEEGGVAEVFARPRHPYTSGLLRCIPHPTAPRSERPLRPIPGTVAMPQDRQPGCGFAPRCNHRIAGRCDASPIPMVELPQHESTLAHARQIRCLRWDEWADSLPPPIAAVTAQDDSEEIMLAVESLDKFYPIEERGVLARLRRTRRMVKANQNLSFRIRRKQTLAIVGESGCGKSTFAKVLMGLEQATAGSIQFAGTDLSQLAARQRTPDQLRALQMVFQNPDETLNPSYSVGAQVARVVRKFGLESSRKAISTRVRELLAMTKLPAEFARRRPHQLSGGQKQRVAIARAFAGNPRAIVADEPVSALDLSVRAAVTELLIELQDREGTTLLVISHDLGLVRYMADRVVVMYLGRIMESGTADQVFAEPYHPYTEALLSAMLTVDPAIEGRRVILEGDVPSAIDPPTGCPFHTRCHRKVGPICEQQLPVEQRGGDGLHRIACHIPWAELTESGPVFRARDAIPSSL